MIYHTTLTSIRGNIHEQSNKINYLIYKQNQMLFVWFCSFKIFIIKILFGKVVL